MYTEVEHGDVFSPGNWLCSARGIRKDERNLPETPIMREIHVHVKTV